MSLLYEDLVKQEAIDVTDQAVVSTEYSVQEPNHVPALLLFPDVVPGRECLVVAAP